MMKLVGLNNHLQQVSSVNPFHVVVYTGDVELDPANDIFTRTIQLEDNNISRTVNREVQFNQNIDLEL